MRVLIVDDDSLIRDVVRTVLEDADYDMYEASDGSEALKVAARCRPDLVLLDVMMPGIDGYEVCRSMRSDPVLRGSVVVMLTSKATPESRDLGIAAGADAYFTKPFSPLELLTAVDEMSRSARGSAPR